MPIDLSERVALVTGSAHRVGKAIAVELARHGVSIMVHYNSADDDTVRETLQEIKSHGVDAIARQADISTEAGVASLFAALRSEFQRLDILVNSASSFTGNRLMDVSLADWQKSMNVNVTAPLLCTQAAVHLMRENAPPGGSIVNILDYGAVRPWAKRADHGISKAALLMLTEVSALTLGAENIRVNGVLPGPVLKAPGMSDEDWVKTGHQTALNRTGSAEDVARAVRYLVSEDFISGTVLHVNGGEHL